jgi:hypothetical protein
VKLFAKFRKKLYRTRELIDVYLKGNWKVFEQRAIRPEEFKFSSLMSCREVRDLQRQV